METNSENTTRSSDQNPRVLLQESKASPDSQIPQPATVQERIKDAKETVDSVN